VIEIVRTGPLATVQDLGRPGYADLGVSPSGAADLASHRLANRLVANPEDAATIEVTLGGLEIVTDRGAWVAVTGAPVPVTIQGRPVGINGPVHVPPGGRLALGLAAGGLRSYLAVRGGIGVEPVLGSRSTDTLGGIGPGRLRPGDRLPVLAPGPEQPCVDLAPVSPPPAVVEAGIEPGPRAGWLSPDALPLLAAGPWRVSADTDRVGVRLDGPRLERSRTGELASEGIVRGAIQVPPSGQPIVFLADHPVTGGYPVVAVVRGADLARLAQARPGCEVRLRWVRPEPLLDLTPDPDATGDAAVSEEEQP
jgi:biotin-dependent carboxylase-like uncharacterized protein